MPVDVIGRLIFFMELEFPNVQVDRHARDACFIIMGSF
jgi:hypothetical protein